MTDTSLDPDGAHPVRVLIVDDEVLARERLLELLEDRDDVDVVGEAEDGPEAVAQIRRLDPDLVFLDVQMPGMDGIDVVEEVGLDRMPVTVFVTAYDQYAIKAFDVAAVDYLLKPFDDERFEEAFRRARRRLDDRELRQTSKELLRLLRDPDAAESSEATAGSVGGPYLERIAVQGRGQVRIVSVDDITHVTADGSYAEVHTEDETHVIRERMKVLEERLDPGVFVRIHRSAIVRLDRVEAILRSGGGDYAVRLTDGTRLSVSRGRVDTLQERLGVDVIQGGER